MATTNHWRLQDTASPLVDVVAANDASIQAGGTFATAAGPGGDYTSSILFDGSTWYNMTAQTTSAGSTNWSFFFRVFPSGILSSFLFGNNGSNVNQLRFFNSTTFRVRTDGATVNDFTSSFSASTWYSILVTHSAANSLRLFVDGVEITPAKSGINEGLDIQAIGRVMTTDTLADYRLADVRRFDSDESANAVTLHNDLTIPSGYNHVINRPWRSGPGLKMGIGV